MVNKKATILYDPVYNFHEGYHLEVIKSTREDFVWKKGKLLNYFEDSIISTDPKKREKYIGIGRFQNEENADYIFSPHILLDTKKTYFMELEDIYWLFSDTYEEINEKIPVSEDKIELFSKYVIRPELSRILWWSHSALLRFKKFAQLNKVDYKVVKTVLGKSNVVYPSSNNEVRSLVKNNPTEFVSVFNSKNFYRKGGDITIKIFEELLQEGHTNWELSVFGDLPSSYKLSKELKKHIIVQKFTEKSRFQSALVGKVFLFLSRADTFGTVLIDAINANSFIISSYGSKVFAIKEIMKKYPNKVLIKNIEKNSVNDVDYRQAKSQIRKIMKTTIKLEPFESSYKRKYLRNNILSILNDV